MKRILSIYTLLVLIMASCNQAQENSTVQIPAEKPQITTVIQDLNSSEAKHLLGQQPEITVLDVRTAPEFAGGHLQKATNLDYNGPDFADLIGKLDKSNPYLVYCAAGVRSRKATQLMHELGFKQIYNATEGFPALKSAGVPTDM